LHPVSSAVRRYNLALSVLFWAMVALACVTGSLDVGHPITLVAPLLGLAIAAEALVIGRGDSSASFSVAAHIATAVLFGPLAAALVASVAVIVVDGLRQGPRPAVFLNSTIFGLAAWAGGLAFLASGGSTGSLQPHDLLPVGLLIVTRFLVNEMLLSVAISIDSGRAMPQVLRDDVRDLLGAAVGEGCLGVLVAFGYTEATWLILPFLVPLLVALYQSQLNFERLKSETAAALNAFAGVIDERDPSTAQHSDRVAEYVERFVEAIALPDREAARLVETARFHDLGKVAVDVSTLSKHGRLTEQELRSIRSHPRLSARLLSPFHFAQEMALYAELHHERYDGNGYYSVPQRDIPVEAHVLIVADSFDAMTSARAYRPPLTMAEAVQELRDKAGTQFHPLVANAFSSMIEGQPLQAAIGQSQLAALRAEFSRIPTLRLPRISALLSPAMLAVCSAAATLAAIGVPGVPLSVPAVIGALTLVLTGITLTESISTRRRRRWAGAVIAGGGSAEAALDAAGVVGWAVWLTWIPDAERYEPLTPGAIDAGDVADMCRRALRTGFTAESGVLDSGAHFTITPVAGDTPRLAFCSPRRLSRFELGLLAEVAARAVPPLSDAAGEPAALTLVEGDQRSDAAVTKLGTVIVDLGVFENVRVAAGQLTAERVVADAIGRLRMLLRAGDLIEQLGEDRLGALIAVADESQLEAVCNRMRTTLAEVPVPRRASNIDATIVYSVNAELSGNPELAEVLRRLTGEQRAAG
jgi:HD-GYP domain-containing protein (c-di-GMP phosphodiesterase class II)/GGDEF domain-containing protein